MKLKDIMKEIKTVRDLIYRRNNEQSQALTESNEKAEADLAYIAMMADVDLEDVEDDEGDDTDE